MASRRSLHKVALLAGALAISGVAHAQTYPSPAVSSLHFVPGTGPASPTNGDCWITINGLFCQVNGATIGPYSSGTVTGIVPIANGGTGTNTVTNNLVFAGPSSGTSAPGFRSLVASDIPTLNQNTTGTAANITGIAAVANGGTGVAVAGGMALDNISGFSGTGLVRRTGTSAYSLGTGVLNSELASVGAATVKANVTASAGAPTDVGLASFALAMGGRCANILLYGGDPTDTNDNSAALSAARAAVPLCVYFPQGVYKFTSAQNISLSATPAAASFMMYGDGPDISVLDFQGNVSGFGITMATVQQSFHVRNMTLATGCNTTGCSAITALLSLTAVSDPASNAASDVTNVTLRGRDGIAQTAAWDYGLNLNKVSNVSLVNSSIFGNSTISPTAGVIVYGTSSAIPVVLNVINSIIDRNAVAINLGSYFQGLQVTNSNMTGNTRGLYVAAATSGIDEVAINNSQFNNSVADIELDSIVTDLVVTGNDIYVQGAGTGIGLNGSVGSYTITGNSFSGLTTSNTNAIQIGAYGSRSGIISGNVFWGLSTGVLLQSSSQRANVQSNSYNTVTNTVINNGTNNIVGGGSQ